jgi:3-hydroxybutyrate dehydrogenase
MDKSIVTIITGGGRGIGKTIALRMAKETAVIVVGRTKEDLESVCSEIEKNGGIAYAHIGDIKDPKTADDVVALIRDKKLTLRNLVCNAGIAKSGSTETFSKELWWDIFDTNVHGHLYFIQTCIPLMIEQKQGTICVMSSIAGVKGYSHTTAYSASKHALVGMAHSLAQEYGKYGIVTVPICPGFVESEMTDRTINGLMERKGLSKEEARIRVSESNPQKRIIPAEEVAEAVAFVCSGKVPSLSGNPLILSGGE